jgi:uncharacterized protein
VNIRILSLFLLVLLGGAAWGVGLSLPSYSGYINDYAGVLNQAETARLEELAKKLAGKTGAEMAVAIVKTAAPADPKTYAHELFNKWGLGQKGKDNGLLICLALEERRVEIEVGYGLEGVINDAKAGAILDKYVIPYFKQGQYGEGLYNGAAALAAEIAKEAKVELGEGYEAKAEAEAKAKDKDEESEPMVTAAITILILLMMFAQGLFFGLIGALVGGVLGFALGGVIGALIGALLGFVVSFFSFGRGRLGGGSGWNWGEWGGGTWSGGGWSGGGGGFGGFGGGGSGGGGAGRSW